MTILAIAAALIGVMLFLRAFAPHLKLKINVDVFFAQIQKLVMANNIDRAIKICNAEPNALAAKCFKHVLTRANRPHELHLVFEEALAMTGGGYEVEMGEDGTTEASVTDLSTDRSLTMVGYLVTLLCYVMFLVIMLLGSNGEEASPIIPMALAVLVGSNLLTVALWFSWGRHVQEVRRAILRLRIMLFKRSSYIPPQLKGKKASPEELQAWRESMEEFNKDLQQARTNGETRPAEEVYEERADSETGVLPKI